MTCPSGEALVAVLDGALAPAALADARLHVEGCPSCRAELARLEAGAAALRAGSPTPEPSPWFATRLAARLAAEAAPRPSRWRAVPWRLAGAGGLAAAVVLGVVVVRHERGADELAAAERLELLEDYEVVASLGDVEGADDVAVVAALDGLSPREGRP